ncbi:MAG: hypothetical protein EBS42_11075 [Caulobacteraceae bacterium]|nr:hypothetical protein [Caulobacteraceae bacterium]
MAGFCRSFLFFVSLLFFSFPTGLLAPAAGGRLSGLAGLFAGGFRQPRFQTWRGLFVTNILLATGGG